MVARAAGSGSPSPSLRSVAEACRHCHACPLYLRATQAVFGEGPAHARLMLVGEQPGNEEDLSGHPFVGPAGGMLDAALAEAGLARADIFVTNAVKHFKFVERGKRRLHEKPKALEIRACRPWLLDELRLVRPRVVVALGATAAAALFGRAVQVMRDRGRILRPAPLAEDGMVEAAVVTIHPSAALRAPSSERRHELRALLAEDLALARDAAR